LTTPSSKRSGDEFNSMPGRLLPTVLALLGFVLCALVLSGIATVLGASPSSAVRLLGLSAAALFTGTAAFCLHRVLVNGAGRSLAAAYRLALVGAALLAFGIFAAQGTGYRLLAAGPFILLGAFGGGLAASWRQDGLWEDNSPPPPDLTRTVLEIHRSRLPQGTTMPAAKRALDLVVAAAGLVVLAPLAIVVCLLLWLEDPGPLFFVKNSVGRGGRNFRQWKLRTMVRGAEAESGPVWSERTDERVLRVGSLLRKTALDELPQLLNVLAGEMSIVGPRPQRTVLVAEYLRRLPSYADRHRLAPGLAGLAQVAGHYYITPRQKLRFDRLYFDHAGLGFDLKLLLIAFAVVFWLRWQPGWRGGLPRAWLHRRRPAKTGID
jgi:lipopolysaccharide/colanic/teichoic acid biosynthesis glycosyltransferase